MAADPPRQYPSEWTAEQVVANTSRLLLGGLDEEDGDNPDPDEQEWEEEANEDHPPSDPLEQISEEELECHRHCLASMICPVHLGCVAVLL